MEKNTGIKRLYKAAFYSYKGFKHGALNEAAFQQEVIASLFLLPVALWVDVTTVERIILVGTVILVLVVELLNTAIEAVVDRVGTEFNHLSGQAKDMGSAAVLLTIFFALFAWVSILYPHLSSLF